MTHPVTIDRKNFKWTIAAFVVAGIFISALMTWQLLETNPARWCGLADITSTENTNACLAILLRLLDIKDHAVIGLLAILGMTVLSVVVVALGVKLTGQGPGGIQVDIGADKTEISSEDSSVTLPTPPSN